MSYDCKGKYEVIKVLRKNILDALISFGQYEMKGDDKVCTWRCIEASQQAPRNIDKVVTMKMTGSKPSYRPYTKYDGKLGISTICWAESQTWEICAIIKRKASAPAEQVTADTVTSEDVIHYLSVWMDTVGIHEFRANGMANNFVGSATIRTYDDDSESGQDKSSLIVTVQVPRRAMMQCDFASPVYQGSLEV